jgi:proline dehydrogenase
MNSERERAAERGYPDPIQPSVEATHACYDSALDRLLLHSPNPEKISLMIATHNTDSCERAAGYLSEGGGSRVPRSNVAFGQLYGMADHLTFGLAAAGFFAYKYLPYGPVREVLPYLIRRARENADALSGAKAQRSLMLREVGRRLLSR